MFRKLVSNLAYNPGLLGEVAFYARRLNQEKSIRRLGLVFMALAIVVQSFAVISPPQSTLASSMNDIIFGGSSKQDVLDAYDANRDAAGRRDIQEIYSYYGITRKNIVDAKKTTLHHSKGTDLFSTGRHTNTVDPSLDVWTPITGTVNGGIYQRPLEIWGNVDFPAITGINSKGQRFWILLKGCGNVVMEQAPLTPDLDIKKKKTTVSDIEPGGIAEWKIFFRNSGQGTAYDVRIKDTLSPELEFVAESSSIPMNFTQNGQELVWRAKGKNKALAPSSTFHWIKIQARTSTSIGNSTVCNSAFINADNFSKTIVQTSESSRCIQVIEPVCPGSGLPIPGGGVEACVLTCPDGSSVNYTETCPVPTPDPEPETEIEQISYLSCQLLQVIEQPKWNTYTFETRLLAQPGAAPADVTYFVDGTAVDTFPLEEQDIRHEYTRSFTEGEHVVRAELTALSGEVRDSSTCQVTINPESPDELLPLPSRMKTVSNLTQSIDNAHGTTANGGDELLFTISVSNDGDAPATNQPFIDDIHDILEYAEITDAGGADFDEIARTLAWPTEDVEPGETITKSFKARILNPIPTTPRSASDPLSYDMQIHNDFGNRVVIELPTTVPKQVEVAVSKLPRTGPGTVMTLGMIGFTVVGYLFFRARLLSKEVALVKAEASGGL